MENKEKNTRDNKRKREDEDTILPCTSRDDYSTFTVDGNAAVATCVVWFCYLVHNLLIVFLLLFGTQYSYCFFTVIWYTIFLLFFIVIWYNILIVFYCYLVHNLLIVFSVILSTLSTSECQRRYMECCTSGWIVRTRDRKLSSIWKRAFISTEWISVYSSTIMQSSFICIFQSSCMVNGWITSNSVC